MLNEFSYYIKGEEYIGVLNLKLDLFGWFVGVIAMLLPLYYIITSNNYDSHLLFFTILILYLGIMLKRTLFRVKEFRQKVR
ncbi:hypothetical protein GCM10010982_06490 [Bowmanella pacifica]|uniref:Uncharacterized protein n=1 Tax=Bowmanella pacifica TaxID=502051 RepID=A0A917YV15_9ALTE|nr:hypothetical protein GCM10010982_06490 [Bowmanella pacifica]